MRKYCAYRGVLPLDELVLMAAF